MFGSPHRRLLWVRILIPLMLIIGVVSALSGGWLMAVLMALLIIGQLLVYRRVKEQLSTGD